MKRYGIWFACFVLSVVCMLGIGIKADAAEDAVIHQGVYLDEVDVSGMTQAQAEAALDEYIKQLEEETLTLQVEEHEVQVKLSDLGLQCANRDVVKQALGLGKSGNIIQRFKEQKELEKSGKVLDLEWTVEPAKVSLVIEEECVQFDVEAADASLKRENGSFTIVPSSTGVKLNVAGSKQAIIDFVEQEWDKDHHTVTLPAEVDYPTGTEEELSKVKDVLATFSTSYSTSNGNRSKNVANGARLINGTVVYPGETFSAYEVISPFTQANGYEMAGAYLNGRVVDSLGGGICQVSTTLYNAVLRAELEVVERHNHSMIVTYVDPSADAAISGTVKDFKFKNNTDAPIYIEGSTSSDKVITFTIYGEETRSPSHEVKFVSKTLSTQEPGVQIIADGGQGIGYIHTESAHRGVKAELYKEVYENGVQISSEKVNSSSYMASPKQIIVGVAGDPNLSAEIQAAVATQDEGLVRATVASCVARIPQ